MEVLRSIALKKAASFNFSMIGGCASVELGYYNPKLKKYFNKEFIADNIEMLSTSGNVAWFENSPVVHAHGVFSGEDHEAFGGHIVKMVISLTGEVAIDWLSHKLIKKYDQETGLNLLSK